MAEEGDLEFGEEHAAGGGGRSELPEVGESLLANVRQMRVHADGQRKGRLSTATQESRIKCLSREELRESRQRCRPLMHAAIEHSIR